jgi:multidrug resistance protein
MAEFHSTNEEIATFVVSVYLLGWVIGPLFLAPLSEMYGRTIVYHVTNILYIGFTVGCAKASSMGMLMGFRLLAGMAGSTPLTIGAGTVADLIPQERRGVTMAVYALGPLLGPAIGPIIGGFLVNAKGWRWVFWLITIMVRKKCGNATPLTYHEQSGSLTVTAFLLLRETYAPVLLERKVARLQKSTGNSAFRSKLSTGMTKSALIKRSSVRPLKLLFCSPIVLLLSIYTAVGYGILYLLFTTFTFVFEQTYHFSTSLVGLAYIGIGVGFFTAAMLIAPASDHVLRRKKAAGLEMKPEDRLNYLFTMPGAFALPAGLFMYGWSADKHTHWIVPIIGTFFVGFGILSSMVRPVTKERFG